MLHEKRLARQINQCEANGSKLVILKENDMVNERIRGEKETTLAVGAAAGVVDVDN